MKLLAMAEDESCTPDERKAFEERADALMAKHMIDRMEAEEALKRAGGDITRKPVVDSWQIQLSAHRSEFTGGNYEFDGHLVDMMKYILKHCNVRVNPDYKYVTGNIREYQIVGFTEDIRYAERIWFNVFKAFVGNVNPHWEVSASLGENAYNYACAGVQWKHQVLLAEKAGDTRLEFPIRMGDVPIESPDNKPWWRSVGKLRRECQKYCKDNELMYPYTNGSQLRVASRVSFARSYRATIKGRLDDMRKKSEKQFDVSDSNKFALAVIDTAEKVDEAFYLAFPQYRPDNVRKRQEEQEFRRACLWASLSPAEQRRVLRDEQREEEKWQRQYEREQRNFKVVREDPAERFNAVAWKRGETAANSVNLRADEEVKEETKRELN